MLSSLFATKPNAKTFVQLPAGKFYRLINHGPCVLVVSGDGEKNNVAPLAWLTTVNEAPPLLALPVAERHYTAELIRRTGEFSVNIPGEDMLEAVIYTGKSSGRVENKLLMAGLTPRQGFKVKTPFIAESIGHIECRVRDTLPYGDTLLFVAEVLYAQARQDMFDNYWITEKARTIHHLGGSYFTETGKRFKVR